MDITITGRHLPISDRFREHVTERLEKVEHLAHRDPRIDVIVARHGSPASAGAVTVEVTCRIKGPVIRAEATAEDKDAAFDAATAKLVDRLKKANDRRRGQRRKVTTSSAPDLPAGPVPAELAALPTPAAPPTPDEAPSVTPAEEPVDDGPEVVELADTPIEVRVKHHRSAPMTLEQALDEMEMVGHDFFLYVDAETGLPSALYRRRGWSYGVLHLEAETAEDQEPGAAAV